MMLPSSILLTLVLGGEASCLWECAGVYHAHEAGMLVWTFEKKGTLPVQYADPSMNVALRTASSANAAGITAVQSAAEADLNATGITAVQNGAVLSLDTSSI